MGDFARPLQISKFIKDVHAGFQLLNLKNDTLRRRSDGIKYSVSARRVILAEYQTLTASFDPGQEG
jgi:hypothetical protein